MSCISVITLTWKSICLFRYLVYLQKARNVPLFMWKIITIIGRGSSRIFGLLCCLCLTSPLASYLVSTPSASLASILAPQSPEVIWSNSSYAACSAAVLHIFTGIGASEPDPQPSCVGNWVLFQVNCVIRVQEGGAERIKFKVIRIIHTSKFPQYQVCWSVIAKYWAVHRALIFPYQIEDNQYDCL